jgi:putative oxygen-independent coproporphyrinogen III oxidase
MTIALEHPALTGTVPAMPAPSSRLCDVRSLYVHIPFCERKCEYCDFTSVAGVSGADAYVSALRSEIATLARQLPGVELDTIFFGGGTPSLIEPESLAAILDSVMDAFTVAPGAEITMEANPSSISAARARVWRGAGFNRISIGVQSLEPDILRFLGRVHDSKRAIDAVDEVRAAGFSSVNCDLIYAVPGLGEQRWRRTLDRVIGLAPDHLSCYELTVEPGTPLHVAVTRGQVKPVDAARGLRQHRIATDVLEAAGYPQYEVSNFARSGAQSRHNLVYWRNGYYIAAGVGAHGHLPAAAAQAIGVEAGDGMAVRYWHGRGIRAYTAAVHAGLLPIAGAETIIAATHEAERLMLGLRLREGVALDRPQTKPQAFSLSVEWLVRAGLVAVDECRIRVTRRGEALLNEVTAQLTAGMDAA